MRKLEISRLEELTKRGLPFDAHKDKDLRTVPTHYLRFLRTRN